MKIIFERFENLIKNAIKKNVKQTFISNLLREKKNYSINVKKKNIEEIFNSSDDEKKNFDKIIE